MAFLTLIPSRSTRPPFLGKHSLPQASHFPALTEPFQLVVAFDSRWNHHLYYVVLSMNTKEILLDQDLWLPGRQLLWLFAQVLDL